jgi:hypothetical protein
LRAPAFAGSGLLDAGDRNAEIVIVCQRLADELLQRLVAEDPPPREVGKRET